MEGVETYVLTRHYWLLLQTPKTIPVMEGVETHEMILLFRENSYSEDYPRYGGG